MVFLSFFLISLSSYYSYQLGIAPFPYLGLFFLIFLYKSHLKRTQASKVLAVFSFYVLIVTFVYVYINNIQILSYIAMLISFSIIFIKNNTNKIIKLIPLYLFVHTMFFLLQFISYYTFNIQLDFISWFGGELQRNMSGTFSFLGVQLFRPSGLFNEPSTFFIHFAPLVAIKWFLLDKKLTALTTFYIIISLLTFSSFGFIFWTLLIILYLIYKVYKFEITIKFSSIVLLILIFFVSSFIFEYFLFFLDDKLGIGNDVNSNADRIGFLHYVLNRDIFSNIFGIGMSNDVEQFIVNDSGLIIYILYKFGMIGLIFFLILGLLLNNYYKKIIFIGLLLTKLKLSYPFFWLIYGILYFYKGKK